MAKCRNCTNLKNHWCEKIVDSPNEEDERECEHYDRMTQSDRIRSMRDEELAEFLSENTNCDCCNIQCQDKLNCPSMSSCYCRHLEWLQSEVEVGEWKKKR